jgi:hypothetical protein
MNLTRDRSNDWFTRLKHDFDAEKPAKDALGRTDVMIAVCCGTARNILLSVRRVDRTLARKSVAC